MDKNRAVVAIAVIVAIALVAAVLMRGKPAEPVAEPAAIVAPPAKVVASAPAPASSPTPTPEAAAPSTDGAVEEHLEIVNEPINYYNGMDPEDQPRAYYELMFSELDKLPPGFVAEGVLLTDMGLQLAPGQTEGSLTSAAERFNFPTNAVGPMWMEDLPAGTDLMVEVQVSPDGDAWGPWQYVTIDTDSYGQTTQYYPDGRPNPNYGYSPGGLLAWGDMQFGYMKYKLTLYSENDNTPTIASWRAHYQDSSMGEGHMATVAELDADIVGDPSTPQKPEEVIVYNPVYNPDEHLEEDELQPGDVVRVEGTPEHF